MQEHREQQREPGMDLLSDGVERLAAVEEPRSVRGRLLPDARGVDVVAVRPLLVPFENGRDRLALQHEDRHVPPEHVRCGIAEYSKILRSKLSAPPCRIHRNVATFTTMSTHVITGGEKTGFSTRIGIKRIRNRGAS